MDDREIIDRYSDAVQSILSSYHGSAKPDRRESSRGPARVHRSLYLGDFGDANSLGLLSELGVTHLLNCAGVYTGNRLMCGCGATSGVRNYRQLEAHDNEKYDMMAHYKDAEAYIDSARQSGGKVLVYCARGVNRSAAICVAYLMAREGRDLCGAVSCVAEARGSVLTNPGFRRQLVQFALQHDRLDPADRDN